MKTPTTLIIMDGFGLSANHVGNAVYSADTPNIDALLQKYPNTQLWASSEDVGLPSGTIGNSEVGHINIGAGRIVLQNLLRISNSINDGSFFENRVYLDAADECLRSGGNAHIFILLSDAGVHSHLTHLWAMLKLLKDRGMNNVYIHAFTDGRDTSPVSGKDYMQECLNKCEEIGIGQISTVMGRFYAMDRDKRWDRIARAYNALVFGKGKFDNDPVHAIEQSYEQGKTDEFIEPVICNSNGLINSGDTVFFLNFRPDRAREITRALTDRSFTGFPRKNGFFHVNFICATQYDADIPNVKVAFPPEFPKNTFGEFISRLGMTQLRIAETEKYAHVTFFFSGGTEQEYPGEARILIPSSREYPTYDLIPQMKANEIAKTVCEKIRTGAYDVVIVNFANCDMVGHTGIFDAVVTAVETVDKCVKDVIDATADMGGISIVTSDHGNAEQVIDPDTTSPHTAHTSNPVPFIICGADVKLKEGRLCDIAPTMLDLMGLEKPPEMTGHSLIIR
ncbi:MAG: 2,3-bisphosphoglycerate-independent phosphoglycerate mutase [Clostridiales bacterium]|jgi:2,3-bisphosphoglycerate-independent phosphoglycerate mutase|nr:2,3-bisphosphoglycerate-independent phosphoglycerate mutase [Clostridiales bacterium]